MMAPLVVVGSVNVDIVLQIARLPLPGETLSAKSYKTFPGGKGANQAAAAARLKYPTYLLGQVGKDGNGKFMSNALKSAGANTSFVKEIEEPTGTAIILLQPSGENSIIIVGGANHAKWDISEEEKELIRNAGAVLLQREIPDAVNKIIAEVANSVGVPVYMDAGGVDLPLPKDLLSYLSIFSPNETELERLTGISISNERTAEEASRALLEYGIGKVLVKMGSQGSILVSRTETIRQSAIPVTEVVDTTGAGDCFTAAFVVALLENKTPQEALKFASRAAALCIQRMGAMSSLPDKTELESFGI